jgi:hypothetical protein
MTADLPVADRCPKCGAAVRVGDPWCTLCYADLRPPAPAPPEPVAPDPVLPTPLMPEPGPVLEVPSGPDPLTAPLENVGASRVAGPSWPCSACGTVNPMASDVCSACGRHFLAGVRENEQPLLELPVVGDITRLNRGHRLAIGFGVVLAVVLLTMLLGFVFG